jgi:hypothetical protein
MTVSNENVTAPMQGRRDGTGEPNSPILAVAHFKTPGLFGFLLNKNSFLLLFCSYRDH